MAANGKGKPLRCGSLGSAGFAGNRSDRDRKMQNRAFSRRLCREGHGYAGGVFDRERPAAEQPPDQQHIGAIPGDPERRHVAAGGALGPDFPPFRLGKPGEPALPRPLEAAKRSQLDSVIGFVEHSETVGGHRLPLKRSKARQKQCEGRVFAGGFV